MGAFISYLFRPKYEQLDSIDLDENAFELQPAGTTSFNILLHEDNLLKDDSGNINY